MPFMQKPRTLRETPNGALTLVVTAPNDEVNILEESEGWAKVELIGAVGKGWVLKTTIGDTPPVPPEITIDKEAFFRQCWWVGLRFSVLPHYLAGVAKLRSDIKNDTQNNQVGPFRFTQIEWDAGRKDAALKLIDFGPLDIKDCDMQCAMFAARTNREFEALKTLLGRAPSACELYLAHLIGPKAAAAAVNNPNGTIEAALAGVPDAELPPGGLTRDQIMARDAKYLRDPGSPPVSVKASVALDRIAGDLQTALDAVKDGIVTAGTEILGAVPGMADLIADATQPTPTQPQPGVVPNAPAGAGPAGNPGAGGALGQLISKGEGGYGSFNRGIAGDSHGARIDFSQMTIGNIMTLQSLPRGNPNRLFAIGKYQVIPVTMKGAVAALGINATESFGPDLQERVFRNYLIAGKRPQVKSFITAGGATLGAAQLALALEFASVADPNTGRSHYGGSGGNRASISVAQTAAALNAERTKFQQNIAAGMSADNAWKALS